MRNVNKRGLKCIFYPLFGQKLAEFVLFLKTIIYSQLNAHEARRKILKMGGDQWLDGGGLRIFLMGGGQASMGGDKGLIGGVPPSPPHLVTLCGIGLKGIFPKLIDH